jgi:hypothetical protein
LVCVAIVDPEPLTSLERSRLPTTYMIHAPWSVDTDLTDLLSNGAWYLSAGVHTHEADERRQRYASLSEVSLTPHPANCGGPAGRLGSQ